MATIKEAEDCCTHLSFLEACGATLRTCPMEAHWVLLYPLQLLMGNIPPASLLTASPQLALPVREPPLTVPPPLASKLPSSPTGTKQQCCPSGEEATGPAALAKEPTCQRQKEGKPLAGLKENCWEALHWDTDLVQATRQMYIEAHHPAFSQEGPHNLSSLFQEMITSANLLGSEICKVQEVWAGQKDLRFTYWAMRGLPKCLLFFCLVSPSESPKVMGLKRIHHPDTLYCHAGLSYCPWCGMKGQNEGTVVNHLWTMHYRLGLVCSGCLHYSTTTSEAM